jgi:uncharacterized protein
MNTLAHAAPLPLTFHPQRVKTRRYGDQVFVVDRLSGKWLFAPATREKEIRGIGESQHGARQEEGQWIQLLSREGLGVDLPTPSFDAMRVLILKITSSCNWRCGLCYDFETEERARVLDETIARNAIEQAIELTPDILQILLHGGEPMLAWPLIESLVVFAEETAMRLGKRVEFTGQSNFSRITDRIVAFSQEHRISWGVSLDGPAVLNDVHRVDNKGKGTHALFMDALQQWPDFVRGAGVMATITSVNAHRLLEVARHIRDLGMPGLDWSLFQAIGRARHRQDFAFDPALIVQSWNEVFEAVMLGEFDGFKINFVTSRINNFFYGGAGNMCLRPKCGAGRDLMSLSADGTIEACDCIDPMRPDIANLGNMLSMSLKVARESDKAVRMRARDMSNAPSCSTCPWFSMCGGTCLAYAKSLDAKSELYCALSMGTYDTIARECAVSGDRISRYLESLERTSA